MKFSSQTLAILKNYAAINSNILLRQGNELSTISTAKNVFAKATIEEIIPVETPIYDLNSLLALLTLNPDADIEFGDTSLTINNNGATFEYYYSDVNIIVAPPQKNITIDEHYKFNLSKEDIQTILKAAAIMSSPMLSFVSKGGNVSVVVGDPKTATSNNYKKVVGEFDQDFNVLLPIDQFKPIHEGYSVTLSKKKFIHLKNVERNLQYWYAGLPASVI